MPIDEIGKLYLEKKNQLIDTLKKRNHSILAHGLDPISESDYEKVKRTLFEFIKQALARIKINVLQNIPQLPKDELLDF